MTFLYPLGLLGLIGIPILILIYIIKSKYTEQTIASTYLWELSERFLKRKKRVSRLSGIISLILQILAVTIISLAIAHPIITVPDSAQEYTFILDASGSMHMDAASGKKTRFEAAKDAIEDRINGAVDGSTYTLVNVGDATTIIFEKLTDKDQAKLLLSELEADYNTLNLTNAIGVAQTYFQENPSTKTILFTDAAVETVSNVEVVNVGGTVENYAVSGVTFTHEGLDLTVVGNLMSYESDRELTVGMFLDGAQEPVATQTVSVTKGELASFELAAKTETYASIEVAILDKDGMELDNRYIIHDVKSENSYKTLIVSDRPFFLKSVIRAMLNAQIDVISTTEYADQSGYGLYIFDSISVGETFQMPTDGTVWLINVNASVAGSGFTVQGDMELNRAEKLETSTSTSSTTQSLLADMKGQDIYIKRYVKCGFNRNFTTLLSYKGSPIVFAGANEYGTREVVIAFDLHGSNLPLLFDYAVLMRNLINYSFPDMVDKTNYECGELATVNMIANCDSVRVESPSGDINYLNASAATDTIAMNEVGVYTITMTVSGTSRTFYIWSSLNEAERVPTQTADSIVLQGQATEGGFDGKYDPLTVMFIVLAVIFLADWMVYCYEKYQLR